MVRFYLVVTALIYTGIGVFALVAPAALAESVGWSFVGPAGVVEVRAMYGGLQLGMAGFLSYCILDKSRHETALVACFATLGGLGVARLFSWLAAGMPDMLMALLVSFELSGCLFGAYLRYRPVR